jgi:hypothetical protein
MSAGFHHIDQRIGSQLMRTISNWMNYRTPRHGWRTANAIASDATGTPDDWSGQFDFRRTCLAGALQTFFGDSTTPDNRTLVGARVAGSPGSWINWKARGVSATNEIVNGRLVRFANAWTDTHLDYLTDESRLKLRIRLLSSSSPAKFRFTARTPINHNLTFADGAGELRNAGGEIVMSIPAPWGEDANGNPIRATMTQVGSVGAMPLIEIAVNEDDLSAASFPVDIDPTTIISGTTDLEDSTIAAHNTSNNYGGASVIRVSTNTPGTGWRGLFRIKGTAIPSGNIVSATLNLYRFAQATGSVGDTLLFYPVKDANDWVEGTGNGSVVAGSCSYNHAKHTGQAWAGGVGSGCGVNGTDHDASPDASIVYAAFLAGGDVLFPVPITPALMTAWRDATRVDNGLMIRPTNEDPTDAYITFRSTEYTGINKPMVTVVTAIGGQGGRNRARDRARNRARG